MSFFRILDGKKKKEYLLLCLDTIQKVKEVRLTRRQREYVTIFC